MFKRHIKHFFVLPLLSVLFFSSVSIAADLSWKTQHPNGAVAQNALWDDKAGQGLLTEYDNQGHKIYEGHYTQDGIEGPQQVFYPNGQIKTRFDAHRGLRHGPIVSYYPSGVMKMMGFYKSGRMEGAFTFQREDTTIREESRYKNGYKDGASILYLPSGQIERIIHYQNGHIVREKK